MKEKLIEILRFAPHGAVGVGPTDEELADHILSRLKCENCKHWKPTGYTSPSRPMFCAAIEGENQLIELSGEFGYDASAYTKPDFFCALFEEK